MDIATLVGLIIAIVGIIGGNVMEGGNPAALINIPGFMIVVLGSLGATMISQSLPAMTHSRPTTLAYLTRRSATSSGCSTRFVV